MEMKLKFINSILDIDAVQFKNLLNDSYPFIRYEFLAALEESGSVCTETGWQMRHLTAWKEKNLIGFMPLYVKTHSYGEYVFDFQWANAFHQSGLNYYPKLLTSIPFTPCSGSRIITSPKENESIRLEMIKAIIDEAKNEAYSSWHMLFPDKLDEKLTTNTELLERKGMQYHWYNQDYHSFDDFLLSCQMKPRKNIKRERRDFKDSEIEIKVLEGVEITSELWIKFYDFYRITYAKRSGNHGYLNQSFFEIVGKKMASNILMVTACLKGEVIAASLFFKDSENLYGRYWGCSHEIEFLHFELCYYQGIDYCIKNGLKHFDAGAQGEHKIARGFKPIETFSYHWIKDERFREAIRHFLNQETPYISESIIQLSTKLPFK